MVIPSAQEPPSTSTMSNAFLDLPVADDSHGEGNSVAPRERSPSELIDSHPVSESSPEPDAADDSYDGASADSDAEDDDAAEDNYDDEANTYSRENSSSPPSARGGRR